MEALTPRGSAVSTLVSIATGELHLRGSLGLGGSAHLSGCEHLPGSERRRRGYLTGVQLEKSAQPVSEGALAVGEELQPVSAEVGDGGEGAAALGVVGVPVSMGMSSKFAVHTGPDKHSGAPVSTRAPARIISSLRRRTWAGPAPTCVHFHPVVSAGVGGFKGISLHVLFLRVRALLAVCAARAPVRGQRRGQPWGQRPPQRYLRGVAPRRCPVNDHQPHTQRVCEAAL